MKIQLTKIDNLIILVLGTDVIQRGILPDETELYDKIQFCVDKLKSKVINDSNEYADTMRQLRELMNPLAAKRNLEKNEAEAAISNETRQLAGLGEKKTMERAQRITAIDDRFEHDNEGLVYLKEQVVPMPKGLVKAILKATYKKNYKYSVESLLNFWKWAVLNPNPEARNDLFGWFKTGDFSITDDGMVVAYRCVNYKNGSDVKEEKSDISNKLKKAVLDMYKKVRAIKKAPKNYGVKKLESGEYKRFVLKTNQGMLSEDSYEGNLQTLHDGIVDDKSEEIDEDVFTDNHTGTMTIKMNEEVTLPRNECDENRNESCSRGLHFMSKKYNLRLGNVKIIVLINPMNIVAFPAYDNTKGRTCAYMPVAMADTDKNGKIITLGDGSFDFDYGNFSTEKLEALLESKGFGQLVEDGIISNEVSVREFSFIRDEVREKIQGKLIAVE